MKKIFFVCLLLLCIVMANAQRKLNSFSISTGFSLYNSKNISVQLENCSNKKNSLVFIAESFLYGGGDAGKYDLTYNEHLFYTGGLLYKYAHSSRNFYHNFKAGALAGVDAKRSDAFVWYSLLMMEQSFCVSPKTQLYLVERFVYLLQYADRNFQPSINVGVKFSL